jgi:alpha-L-arabinofuranosidase
VQISLDEWGQMAAMDDHFGVSHRLADAVFFAGCYNAILRHADRVPIATVAQLVNVLAPIQTVGDRHFVTVAYLVGLLYRWASRRDVIRADVSCADMAVPAMPDMHTALLASSAARIDRRAAALDASATADERGTSVFLANRRIDAAVQVTVRGLEGATDTVLRTVSGPSLYARNDVDHPDVLHFTDRAVDASRTVNVELPPATCGALIARG